MKKMGKLREESRIKLSEEINDAHVNESSILQLDL